MTAGGSPRGEERGLTEKMTGRRTTGEWDLQRMDLKTLQDARKAVVVSLQVSKAREV